LIKGSHKLGIALPPWITSSCHSGLSYSPGGQIYDAVTFVVNQKIQGDFLEFGVHAGSSFIRYMKCFNLIHQIYEDQYPGYWRDLAPPRFFAFDSFKGLPEIKGLDLETDCFTEGEYCTSEEDFLRNIKQNGFQPADVITVPGFYDESLKQHVKDQHSLTRASDLAQ
jgi:O-methyltransferase